MGHRENHTLDKMVEEKNEKKIEREYIIPLKVKWERVPRYKRANKAVRTIKEFLARHMKVKDRDLKKIKINKYLNEMLWSRGIKKPPIRIKVKAVKEGEIVLVDAVNINEKLKFKKTREERMEKRFSEEAEKKITRKEAEKPEEKELPEEKKTEEEKEKKAAVVEAGIEMEKAAAKQAKHQAKGNAKQPKHQPRMALQK